jgi:putative nucleotidyltransferase with HDIG domain
MPSTCRVIVIDEEPDMCSLIRKFLKPYYVCHEAHSAEQALELLAQGQAYDLIISDVKLGNVSGIDLLRYVKQRYPRTATIIMSGAQGAETAVDAFRCGAEDYLIKPFDVSNLLASIKRAFRKWRLQHARTLQSAHAWRATAGALMSALAARDNETYGHAKRVVHFSLRLGEKFRLNPQRVKDLEFGAMLHDIGKIGVPDAILRKPGKLNEAEWEKMRQHPVIGARMLRGISFLKGAARVVAQHHERWDGTGYPCGLKGSRIDVCARIFAVVDAFDAITSDRVYRLGSDYETALRGIIGAAGTQFDPQVVEVFSSIPASDWEDIRQACTESDGAVSYNIGAEDTGELGTPLKSVKEAGRINSPLKRTAIA